MASGTRLLQKGIGVALVADGGADAMARRDDGGLGKPQEFVVKGCHHLVERAAPQVSAADTSGEKSVPSKELRAGENGVVGVGGQVERNATWCVAGSVEDVCKETAPL